MKLSRNQVQSKTHAVPELRFEDQKLTSFAGLFVFQLLFQRLDLKNRLRNCFHHLRSTRAYDHAMVVLGLVIHLLIGFRQLRDVRFYRDDPMVLRALGVTRLPDVATVSRLLATTDSDSVTSLRQLIRQMVQTYDPERVFRRIQQGTMEIDLPGVVCIDEVDAHLHPPWQRRIGGGVRRNGPRRPEETDLRSELFGRNNRA